jgi:hypothetical protein
VLCFSAEGCSPQWRKKFVRKRKSAQAAQPVLAFQTEAEATYPPAIRYQEHFALWKAWHSGLLDSYGEIRKRDLRYLKGAVGELQSMAQLLNGPPADRIQKVLAELNKVQRSWATAPEPWNPPPSFRGRLERVKREVDRELHYSKVKDWIPSGTSGSTKR